MRQCFEAVTVNAARVMGLESYGLDVGCNADFVLLQARAPGRRLGCKTTSSPGLLHLQRPWPLDRRSRNLTAVKA